MSESSLVKLKHVGSVDYIVTVIKERSLLEILNDAYINSITCPIEN